MENIRPIICGFGGSSAVVASSAVHWANEKNKKLIDCDNEFVKVENLNAHKSHLIEFRRGLHEHWGIYIGDKEIIDLVNLGNGKGVIRRESLSEVADNSLCRVNNLVNEAHIRGLKPKNEDEILKSAYDMLGKIVVYHILDFNCEHFATKCFYGTPFSVQSDVAKKNPLAYITAKILSSSEKWNVDTIEYVGVERLSLECGDLIEIHRESEDHWGVYVGEGSIIHLINLGNKKGKVCKDLLAEVSKNWTSRVNNLEAEADKRGLVLKNKDQIVKTAYGMLFDEVAYDYLNYNCEHFATYCLYGTAFSVQSDIVKKKPSKDFTGRICCSIVTNKK